MRKNNIENQDVIIINNTYAGRYGQNKDNLPHEMINFFRADDDPNNKDNNPGFYIYITPAGIINNKIKKENIKGIIFIRNAGNGIVEVLGKAELGENSKFYTQGISSSKENQIAKVDNSTKKVDETKKCLKAINEAIKYGGKELSKIHEGDEGILVSMKVDKICLPKKTFYLTYKAENTELLNDVYFLPADGGKSDGKKIANESMLAYYYEDDNTNAYNVLRDILNDEKNEFWKGASDTPFCDTSKIDDEIKYNDNFFKITRQQDNEVMFSNMLFYYFSNYPDLLKHFVKKQFNIDLVDNYTVEREKERMDIRIIDDKHYIIIENKIKSGINGIKKEPVKKNENENKNKSKIEYTYENGFAVDESKKYLSQLSDYLEKADKARGNREIKAYILAPDYSSINKNLLSQKYSSGDKYEIFHYSDVKDIFLKYNGVKPPYYDDFLSALDKHTKPIDDEHRLDLLYRLKCRIDSME